MAKKTINKELTGAQDLYNFLFEACNIGIFSKCP